MLIVKFILWVIAILLILLFVLSVLFIISKVGVHIDRKQDKSLQIWIKIGFLNIKIYPITKSEKTKEDSDSQYEYKQKDYKSKFSFENVDIRWCLDLIFDIIEQLKGKILIDKLYFTLILASDDAAKTGIMLGSAFSLSGMLLPVLEQNFRISDRHIVLDADFKSNEIRWDLDFIGLVRPISLIFVMICHRKEFFKLYNDIKKQ